MIILRKMPNTVASGSGFSTLRFMSSGVAAASAVLTASNDRFNHAITSVFAVTVFSMFALISTGGSTPITCSKPKFAVTMCMYSSLVERTPGSGRHEKFSAGHAHHGRVRRALLDKAHHRVVGVVGVVQHNVAAAQ